MSFLTGTNAELIYASPPALAGTAHNTFTSEVNLNDVTGMGPCATLPAGFFLYPNSSHKSLRIVARGIVSITTGSPTWAWTVRMGSAANSTTTMVVGGSGATASISTALTNAVWEAELDVVVGEIPGGSAATPGRGLGLVGSPVLLNGAASLFGGAASPGTFATIDPTVQQYISVNAACGTSSALNSIQLLQLLVWGLN